MLFFFNIHTIIHLPMRNRYFLLLIALLFSLFSFAQSKKGQLRIKPNESYTLYVSFLINFDFDEKNYNEAIIAQLPQFRELMAQYGVTAKKGIDIPAEKLMQMEEQAIKITGNGASVRKLNNIIELTANESSSQSLLELAQALEESDKVEYCSLVSHTPIKPPGDLLPNTPLYTGMQNYMGNSGVNMDFAWDMGLTGEGINIRDVEYGFNVNHEEFNDINAHIATGMSLPATSEVDADYNHGTAVAGIVYAHNGDYGVTGMAYGANEWILYPERTTSGGYNRVNAVTKSINNSTAGDVIIYEMQTFGVNDEYIPAEYEVLVWDLTKAASDAGIVIVAAAGNGSGNLDSPFYNSYMNRGDSGAIIVGAGSNNNQHVKLDFSTYGERVDVQGWGQGVFTTAYGDYAMFINDIKQSYTSVFNGTSSATPIVASCVIVLQSYYHQLTGEYLTGPQMRDLLKATGTSQGAIGGVIRNIGPIPNMENAIAEIGNMLGVGKTENLGFTAYPNPVQEKLYLKTNMLASYAAVEIYNAVGQLVFYKTDFSTDTEVDFSGFSKGLYIVKLTADRKVFTKKVVKK